MSRPRLIALLLALITLVAYLPVARDGFSCYDDDVYITDNRVVQNGLTWVGTEWAFTTWHAANWHPLTWLSHMLDCELFGLNAGAQHYVNVLFHTANAVLLLLLMFQLTDALWPSAFVAALFAWHPLHVESVAWISERKDVLSTFFGILTLLAYTRYAQSAISGTQRLTKAKKAVSTPVWSQTAGHGSLYFWLAVICFALGLMAKPMLVTLPFVMLLLDYWPLRRFLSDQAHTARSPIFKFQFSDFLRLTAEKWPFFLLSAASCIVTFVAQHSAGAVASLAKAPLHYRLENTPVAYAHYLLKMVWPTYLAVLYPLHLFSWPVVVAAVATLAAISWLVWRMRRQYPYGLVGWLWFLGTLVPVIGLVQVGSAAMADRYTYFPSIGIFLIITFWLRELVKRFHISKSRVVGVAALSLMACLGLTENQLRYWRNDVALFSHAIAVTKDNDIAYLNLGFALENEGQNAGAMVAFRKALLLDPDRAETHNNLANLLAAAGHANEALAEYRAALRINSDYVAAHENLGTLFARLGRFDEAMNQYAEAARRNPKDWRVPYLVGKALLRQGRDVEAISHFQQALQMDPGNLQILAFWAQVLASDENPTARDGRTAFLLASEANALTGGVQPAMLDLVAMACAEVGRFDDAVKAEQEALDVAKTRRMTNDEAVIRQRLQLYQKHQPLRQTFTNALLKELPK
ncbi:MAG: tetratricopeptide repeat protein [Verrucomicrobiia bacterium]